jgi:signal transduction histidine kinase
VIGDVLDFSRIEAGKLELESIPFAPQRVIDHVGSLMAEIARLKGVALSVHCAADMPAFVVGDPERLKQCLFNLLSNACKVSPSAARRGCAGSCSLPLGNLLRIHLSSLPRFGRRNECGPSSPLTV